jgi:hypothetical protein
LYKENIKDMDSFIERFCAKYYFPYAEGRQLIVGLYINMKLYILMGHDGEAPGYLQVMPNNVPGSENTQ